ncbi:MAG: hypothetical protein K2W82_18925 [Candidatus Obscuribacterales bacterium]|nr:hypothetical protein [Candidatus Obscuribacterales bacterium]
MIWASIKMGWQDKRLLLPSILTVFTNVLFGCIFFLDGIKQMGKQAGGMVAQVAKQGHGTAATVHHGASMPTHGLLGGLPNSGSLSSMVNMTQLNGPGDPNGIGGMNWNHLSGLFTTDNLVVVTSLMMIWWLTNRFLEGVTTAMVYSHLTEGKGSGKFSDACTAVLQSLPAIVMLGMATLIVKKIAGLFRNKGGAGVLGLSASFLAGIVEVFWTLAGHLILPIIIIEGCSFWGGLKRADKVAQGSLLTIGIGEVGVNTICNWVSGLVYLGGGMLLGGAFYAQINMLSAPVIIGGLIWVAAIVVTTAMSIYIRAAFYTCLYVWVVEAEAVEESERVKIKAPGPLAAALA